MITEIVLNGQSSEYQTSTVKFDDKEFEVLLEDGFEYLHYIGNGSKSIKNAKGNINCYKMFAGYSGKYLDLSKFDTSEIRNMSQMFYKCTNLLSLDLSGFNTTNVKYMRDMFESCESLLYVDISSFRTDNLKNGFWKGMTGMFRECHNLLYINLGGVEISRDIDDIRGELIHSGPILMFSRCYNLVKISGKKDTISCIKAIKNKGNNIGLKDNVIFESRISDSGKERNYFLDYLVIDSKYLVDFLKSNCDNIDEFTNKYNAALIRKGGSYKKPVDLFPYYVKYVWDREKKNKNFVLNKEIPKICEEGLGLLVLAIGNENYLQVGKSYYTSNYLKKFIKKDVNLCSWEIKDVEGSTVIITTDKVVGFRINKDRTIIQRGISLSKEDLQVLNQQLVTAINNICRIVGRPLKSIQLNTMCLDMYTQAYLQESLEEPGSYDLILE